MNDAAARKILASGSCAASNCAKSKTPGSHVLCFEFHRRLPQNLKRGLYLKLGAGLAQAIDRALGWLRRNPPHAPPEIRDEHPLGGAM